MENPKGVDFSEVQTGNWNVAKSYTSDKIHKWLVLIDNYRTIVIFGYSNLESDVFMRDENLKNKARIDALKRLIHAILSLISNTKFAVRKNAQSKFDGYKERLKKIEKNIYKLKIEKKRGNKIIELLLREDLLEKMVDEITDVIDDVNAKLNESNLIFTHTEEYDPKKIKEGYKEKYINRN